MKQQAIYKDLAKYYDLLYPDKDYKKESDKIRQLSRDIRKRVEMIYLNWLAEQAGTHNF